MLERLFLQAERCALVEDRRRVRRDPGQCRHTPGVFLRFSCTQVIKVIRIEDQKMLIRCW